MAVAMAHCVSCCRLPAKLKTLSISNSSNASFKPLSFSSNVVSGNVFSRGVVLVRPVKMHPDRFSIVCESGTKKADSAAKRARQAEKRRIYHKAKKSEVRTRMKKVLEALEVLGKKSDAQQEEVLSVEKLIADAYSSIDKAVKVGTLHRNTGARRKSRLARRKKAVEIHHGWYAPAPAPNPDPAAVTA
ncbi:30S ribosomal protein S20, chloroplastic [Andrographis paniculata]|uniref:30S ribosomal protein S20, chloroplastic n=1 Tax=Andrographis paniculata TaxID=175694 RepID=UPI0021E99B0A|nr:30S ribosomal protein S20, chloroplastic [Andrographis paniculata]